jgi:ATP-dependent exoDNAse (exonuclease V) beta subunit
MTLQLAAASYIYIYYALKKKRQDFSTNRRSRQILLKFTNAKFRENLFSSSRVFSYLQKDGAILVDAHKLRMHIKMFHTDMIDIDQLSNA